LDHLMKRFGEVQYEVGEKLSYLGMQIEIKDKGTIVGMSLYVKKLLEGMKFKQQACTSVLSIVALVFQSER
jgi:hypothetical protein